jgi:hypothetical protein
MRFVMMIPLPTAKENPEVGHKDFDKKLRNLFAEVGALTTYSTLQDDRRIEWVVVDISDLALITPTAKFIFDCLNVKPEFLPEMTPKPYFRHAHY